MADARDAVDARDLERLLARERRQERGEAPREHRLAAARRPLQQQVVPTRGRDLQCAQRQLVSAHVGQVRRVGWRRRDA